MPGPASPVVVLDDDPTGTQAAADVDVLLDWSGGVPGTAYVLTNTRAYDPGRAYAVTRSAAEAAPAGATVVLRGDSTLRGHVREEYLAVAEAAGGPPPVLLLAPAMPSGGRTTVGGVHLLHGVPVARTEYARDPDFAYTSSRLADWADERSAGLFPAADAIEVPLATVRGGGAAAVAEALGVAARRGRPCACVPDAETVDDLRVVAGGLRLARERGVPVVVRSAPTLAALLAERHAEGPVRPPRVDGPVLVVCGSWVPTTTRQLARLAAAHPGALVEVDPAAPDPRAAAAEVDARLAAHGLAVLATRRGEPAGPPSEAVARTLAATVPLLATRLGALVTKGGVTGAVTVRYGLGATRARVLGPLLPGVALWRVGTLPVAIFPGNVGDDDALTRAVTLLRP